MAAPAKGRQRFSYTNEPPCVTGRKSADASTPMERCDTSTMRKLTLIQEFNILTLAALVVFVVVFGWIVTTSIEHSMISRAKTVTS
ncbi:MAG: hypothetical protein V3S64_10635, partial [bacterium]